MRPDLPGAELNGAIRGIEQQRITVPLLEPRGDAAIATRHAHHGVDRLMAGDALGAALVHLARLITAEQTRLAVDQEG